MTFSPVTYTQLKDASAIVTLYAVNPRDKDQGLKAIWKKSPTYSASIRIDSSGELFVRVWGEYQMVEQLWNADYSEYCYVVWDESAPAKGKRGNLTNNVGKELKHGEPTRVARIPVSLTPELIDAWSSIQATVETYRQAALEHSGEPRYDQLAKLLNELENLGL